MAIGTGIDLGEVEYSWYASRVGAAANTTLEDIKREFWISEVGEQTVTEPNVELELRWLRSLTGVTSDQYGDMWREAVVGENLPPQETITQNKVVYYKNVAA